MAHPPATRALRGRAARRRRGIRLCATILAVALVAASCAPAPAVRGIVAGSPPARSAPDRQTAPPPLSETPPPSSPPSAVLPSAMASSVPFSSRTPTRVVVASLGIDLPIVAPSPDEPFPLCDVAEYLPSMSRPGSSGATYLYAHARAGMFLPLLEASVYDEARLRRAEVRVYTDDDELFTYRVSEVRRGQSPAPSSLADALNATTQQLWLQTSEGATRSSTKLIVIALPEGAPVAVSRGDAHPTPHPLVCS